jgi:hypothetical protein
MRRVAVDLQTTDRLGDNVGCGLHRRPEVDGYLLMPFEVIHI